MNWTILDGDYYISPISGDDAGTGTRQRPFKTVARAMAYDNSLGNIANKKFVIEGGSTIPTPSTPSVRKLFYSDGENTIIDSITTDLYITFNNFTVNTFNSSAPYPTITFINCIIKSGYISSTNGLYGPYFNKSLIMNFDVALNNATGCTFNNCTLLNCTKTYGNQAGTKFYGDSNYIYPPITSIAYQGSYNAVLSSNDNGQRNLIINIGFDAKFVNSTQFNVNIKPDSPLANAGKPDNATGLPTNIGCGKVVNSFNGSNLGGTHNGTAFDIDNNLVLNGTKVGEFTSSVLDVGAVKNIRSIMFNQLKEWNVSGFPLKFCGGEKWFKSLPVVSATSNTLVMPTSYLISSDYFSGSSDTYVRIISGTGSLFTRNPSASASSGQAVIPISNTSGVYLGQSISGTGIPANTIVSSIINNTSITLSANLTSGLTTSSVLTFSKPRNQVTALNATTGEMSLSSNWQVTPDATSVFEFFRIPVNLNIYYVRWSSISEADVSTQAWCKMIIGKDIKFSMFSGNRVGIGDDNFDAVSSEYIRARWFQIIVKLHDLS